MKKAIKLVALALVLTLSVVMLASCLGPNADPEKALAALKENGYKAAEDDTVLPFIFAGLGVKDVDVVISGTAIIDEKAEHVTIVYFEDKDAAEAAWEDLKEYAEKEDEDSEESDWNVALSGKMIYWGTFSAIKAAQ